MNKYEFLDEELNRAANDYTAKIRGFKRSLDSTSQDISNLEKWLQECSITVVVSIDIPGSMDAIEWSKYDNKWRLLYAQKDYDEFGNGNGYLYTPLIETPVKTRLLSKPLLPELVEELARLIPDAPTDENGKLQLGAPEEDKSTDNNIFASEDEIPY